MEYFVKNPFECQILPGYFILLIIPGMTIINSGSILINPAIRVAPLAWEMLFAASNLWTITFEIKGYKIDQKRIKIQFQCVLILEFDCFYYLISTPVPDGPRSLPQ